MWQHVLERRVCLTLHCTQDTCRSTVSLCTAHNKHAALQSHSALHTTHMPLYSLTLHCTQHTHTPLYSLTLHCTQQTCRSTVSLCTAHNTHAALQSHSALHTTHMPLYSLTLHCTQHTCRSTVSLCTAHNTHAALRHAVTSPNLYNDVILPSVLT